MPNDDKSQSGSRPEPKWIAEAERTVPVLKRRIARGPVAEDRPPPATAAAREGRHIVEAFSIVLAPLIVGLLAALALSLPDQTREIYRVFARDYVYLGPAPIEQDWLSLLSWAWQRLTLAPIDLSWIGALMAGVLNWILARNLTLLFARDYTSERSPRGFLLRWLPRLCGALIPIGAGTGLLLAADEVHKLPFDVLASPAVPRQEEAAETLRFMAYFFYGMATLLVMLAYFRTSGRRREKYQEASRHLFCWQAVVALATLTAGLVVLFAAPLSGSASVRVAWALGTPALFCVFVMLLAYFTTGLSILTLARGVPIIPLIALYVLLVALADFNDNHTVTVAPSEAAVARPGTREAFLSWYRSRADREFYERAGKPYPVFLVTAAGGGLYAADFAATGLARLQDGCPLFAQHTFAVSGVSGGGFGAALFSTLLSATPQLSTADIQRAGADPCAAGRAPPGAPTVEMQVGALLNQDYLAPVVAAGLFSDFPQRFLPLPIPALDRSRAFEATLDHVWRTTRPECTGDACQPFSGMFLDSWKPASRAPALVLNTTNVDVGYRTVISPFEIARDVPGEYSALQNFHEALSARGATGGDVTLAAAIGLSSRFPWLMPAATIRLPDGRPKLRLLDGGIFENSGVDTLADMLIDLAGLEAPPSARTDQTRSLPWVEFHPIVISGYQLNAASRASGLRGEILSPVSAMLSARVQRAGMASYRLFLARGYACGKGGQSERCDSRGLRFLVLNHEDFRLPLGWQLSPFTQVVVRHHVGDATQCDPIPSIRDMFTGPSPYQRQQYTLRENNCTACAVRQTIRGVALEGSDLCRSP